jgi:hypothetical protein
MYVTIRKDLVIGQLYKGNHGEADLALYYGQGKLRGKRVYVKPIYDKYYAGGTFVDRLVYKAYYTEIDYGLQAPIYLNGSVNINSSMFVKMDFTYKRISEMKSTKVTEGY